MIQIGGPEPATEGLKIKILGPVERKRGGEQELRERGKEQAWEGNNFRDLIFFICFNLWLFCG